MLSTLNRQWKRQAVTIVKLCALLSNNNKILWLTQYLAEVVRLDFRSLFVLRSCRLNDNLCVRQSHCVSLTGMTLYIPECCWATLRTPASNVIRNNAIWLPVRPVFLACPDPPIDFVRCCAVGRSTLLWQPGYQLECSTFWVEPEQVMCKAWSLQAHDLQVV